MITLNIQQICKVRGINFPLKELTKAGISYSVAWEYLNNPTKQQFTVRHIEVLCKLLNCTPNDLFSWEPNNEAEDVPTNPLQKIRKHEMPDMVQHINNMSMEELKTFLEQKG